ncbi:MAG: glycosyl transferase, partial [Alphaproteobacteria bacterium PA3]
MRLDADEIIDQRSTVNLLQSLAQLPISVAGAAVQRRIIFMNKRIRYGGIEPSWQLRLFRAKRGSCEQRWMDEHIVVAGSVIKSSAIIYDHNLKPLTWWTNKHNAYASREAIDLISARMSSGGSRTAVQTSPGARIKRFVKVAVYNRLPSGGRAVAYFLYRYFLRVGFFDGRRGFYFH